MEKAINELKENGFVIFPALVPEDMIQKVFQQIEDLLDEALTQQNIKPGGFKNIDEKYLYLKNKFPIIKSHVYDLVKHLDSVLAISNLPQITEFIKTVFSGPLLVDHPQVRADDNSNDRLLPFHQEGVGQISSECITVWVPMMDLRQENGALRYIPKSHLQGFVKYRFYPELSNYHGIREEYVDESKIEYACLKKGDALVFGPCLFHGSTPNKTEEIRWTYVTRFNSVKGVSYIADENAPMRIEQIESKD
ncbi:MAG: phytanoyl-CoA dioxygenase family protein [Candidatus Brocadiales bacterium]|nr:phytanoyl-CoA dioxygenase family protein [Candidatus Brocadiales bacterium]